MVEGRLPKKPRAYRCPHCDEMIRVIYLQPGEQARCNSCAQHSIVPENAIAAEEGQLRDFQREALSAGNIPQPEPPEDPRIRALRFLAWAAFFTAVTVRIQLGDFFIHTAIIGHVLSVIALVRIRRLKLAWYTTPVLVFATLILVLDFLPLLPVYTSPLVRQLGMHLVHLQILLIFAFLWRITKRFEPTPGVQWLFPLILIAEVALLMLSIGLLTVAPAAAASGIISPAVVSRFQQLTGIFMLAVAVAARLAMAIAIGTVIWDIRRGKNVNAVQGRVADDPAGGIAGLETSSGSTI